MSNRKKRRYLTWLVATLAVEQRDDQVRIAIMEADVRRNRYSRKLETLYWDIEQRREALAEAVDALSALGSRAREEAETVCG